SEIAGEVGQLTGMSARGGSDVELHLPLLVAIGEKGDAATVVRPGQIALRGRCRGADPHRRASAAKVRYVNRGVASVLAVFDQLLDPGDLFSIGRNLNLFEGPDGGELSEDRADARVRGRLRKAHDGRQKAGNRFSYVFHGAAVIQNSAMPFA